MNEDIIAQKKALRRQMRERKAQLTPEAKQAEADRVFSSIEKMEAFQQAEHILLYYSLPDELPTHIILERWHKMKKVYLPRVKGDDLEIVAYTGELDDHNEFHIGEPVGPVVDFIPELIIVPAVALDTDCHRMGRGRGYYDRLLSASHSYLIGVALDCQLVPSVPCEAHDQKLNAIVTASQISIATTENRPLKSFITPETKVSDVVLSDPSTVTVLNRFGIKLGVGDKTVEKICSEHNINPAFFTTILNTFIHKDYFPDRILDGFSGTDIVDYLSKTNAYYEHYQLPNIERHFQLLINKSAPQNNNLELMLKFFHEVKQELLNRIVHDRERVFPDVLSRINNENKSSTMPCLEATDNSDSIEDKIDDLISMMVIHLQGDYDTNLGLAVLIAIVSLKKDITQNNRIRNRIMRPLHEALSAQR